MLLIWATTEKHLGEVPPASPLMSTPEPHSGDPREIQTCQRRKGVVLISEMPPASRKLRMDRPSGRKGTMTQQFLGAFKLFLLLQPLLALFSTAKSCVIKRPACQRGAGITDVTATAGDRKRAPQRCSPINALLNTFHFYIKYHSPHHPVLSPAALPSRMEKQEGSLPILKESLFV